MTQEHTQELCRGMFAVLVNGLAVVTSTMEDVEYWLRVTSLIVGISIGILTLIPLVLKYYVKIFK